MTILSMQADFWKYLCYLFKGKGHKSVQEEIVFSPN